MIEKRQTFALFFPQPMDEADKTNLLISGVQRIQAFLNIAHNNREQLRWLAGHGIRVVFRIDEPSRGNAAEVAASYYRVAGRVEIARKIGEIRMDVPGLNIEAVIGGNEPEIEYDLRRNAVWGDRPEANFAQGRVWEHRLAVSELRRLLAPTLVVAPGWSHKQQTPRDAPEPGRATWGRIVSDVYNQGPGGLHAYCINWAGPEDENRLLWWVKHELERIHGDVWINEINVVTHALDTQPVDRMRAVLAMYDLLAAQQWSGAIKSYCPFVSNGLPGQQWSNMIMRARGCYEFLAQWMGQ